MKKILSHKIILLFLKPKALIALACTAFLVVGGYALMGNNDPLAGTVFAKVEKRDLVQKVSVTGRVKPSSAVSLAFEKSGRINRIFVSVGQKIQAGTLLVSLENADLQAQYAQANAGVKAAQAKLDELKRGSTPEEIAVQKVRVANAETALGDARRIAIDTLQSAYVNTDDVIHNKTDQFFFNPSTVSVRFNQPADTQIKSSLEEGRLAIQLMLDIWRSSVYQTSTSTDLATTFSVAKRNLSQTRSFIDLLAQAVNSLTPGASLTQATIDAYKASVLAARTSILTQISEVSTAEKAFRTAESNLSLEQSQLSLDLTPTRSEQLLAQEAVVEEAQANADSILAQIAKTMLRSPISGQVTAKEAEVGEIIAANTPVVSVISQDAFKIEANVTESDIAAIAVNNMAEVTLDAYGDALFSAKVTTIDPAEVLIDGVPTYKVTLHFFEPDERIRSGMTADIDIVTAESKDTLVVPTRAVVTRDGKRLVRVRSDENKLIEKEVTTGIKDGEGLIEVISGLSESEEIVVFIGK